LAFEPGLFEGTTEATGLFAGATDTTETQALNREAVVAIRASLTRRGECIMNRPVVSKTMLTLMGRESSPSVSPLHEKGLRIAPQP
jgi:hypothetical protein